MYSPLSITLTMLVREPARPILRRMFQLNAARSTEGSFWLALRFNFSQVGPFLARDEGVEVHLETLLWSKQGGIAPQADRHRIDEGIQHCRLIAYGRRERIGRCVFYIPKQHRLSVVGIHGDDHRRHLILQKHWAPSGNVCLGTELGRPAPQQTQENAAASPRVERRIHDAKLRGHRRRLMNGVQKPRFQSTTNNGRTSLPPGRSHTSKYIPGATPSKACQALGADGDHRMTSAPLTSHSKIPAWLVPNRKPDWAGLGHTVNCLKATSGTWVTSNTSTSRFNTPRCMHHWSRPPECCAHQPWSTQRSPVTCPGPTPAFRRTPPRYSCSLAPQAWPHKAG